ncbi:MAG: ATPase [Pseudomonadota bacterium]
MTTARASGAATLPEPEAFLAAPRKAIALFGMSGVGKTRLAQMMRGAGGWFHYSVDYRIATRYLDEAIVDMFKREAMQSALLREMLRADAVRVDANIRFSNLAALSAYVGKPGDPAQGGLAFEEYITRQRRHREAEVRAMGDALEFMAKAHDLYGYPHFLCDTSGSLVEVVDPDDAEDPVMRGLADKVLFVLIKGEASDEEELVRRFIEDPKPIYYNEGFLRELWSAHRAEAGAAADIVDPDEFARSSFRKLVRWRAPRYRAIAARWGVSVAKSDLAAAQDEPAVLRLIAEALEVARQPGAGAAIGASEA